MNKLKIVLAIILTSCSVFATACDNNKLNGNAETISVNAVSKYTNGIHEMNYTETNDFLVKDNKTEYAILVPSEMNKETKFAAEELQQLFKEATKCDMLIVKDDAVGAYSANQKYISLGNTTYAVTVGAKPTADLDRYGYSIKTIDKSIFINANSDIGVTFGVYGFLELQYQDGKSMMYSFTGCRCVPATVLDTGTLGLSSHIYDQV